MGKASVSFEDVKADLMKDQKFKLHYKKLRLKYGAIEQLIKLREKHRYNLKK